MAKKLANKFSPIIIVILIAVFLYFILRACNVYEGMDTDTGFEVEEIDGSRKPIKADTAKFKTFLQDANIEFTDTSTGGSSGSVTTYNNF